MTQIAIAAATKINKEGKDKCGVLHLNTIKPLDKDILMKLIPKVRKIITVEENVLAGGFGSSILEFVSDYCPENLHKISRIWLPDKFINKYGTQDQLINLNNLSVKNLFKTMRKKNV